MHTLSHSSSRFPSIGACLMMLAISSALVADGHPKAALQVEDLDEAAFVEWVGGAEHTAALSKMGRSR